MKQRQIYSLIMCIFVLPLLIGCGGILYPGYHGNKKNIKKQ